MKIKYFKWSVIKIILYDPNIMSSATLGFVICFGTSSCTCILCTASHKFVRCSGSCNKYVPLHITPKTCKFCTSYIIQSQCEMVRCSGFCNKYVPLYVKPETCRHCILYNIDKERDVAFFY